MKTRNTNEIAQFDVIEIHPYDLTNDELKLLQRVNYRAPLAARIRPQTRNLRLTPKS